jgi:hypothetical protein
MADLLQFPSVLERNEREMRAVFTEGLRVVGFASEEAARRAIDITAEYLDYQRELTIGTLSFTVKESERELLIDIVKRCGTAAQDAWVRARLLVEATRRR